MNPRESYNHPDPLGPALTLSRVTGVDLHHTAGDFGADPKKDLLSVARYTKGKFGRSSYNFAIHPSTPNAVWEMQGLHIGAHNDGENSTRLGLVVFGNYEIGHPSNTMLQTIADFVVLAHDNGWVTEPHIKGHRDTDPTSCPGKNLYDKLPTIRKMMTMSKPPSSWAANQWKWAESKGIVSEDSDPHTTMTKQEFVVMLKRYADKVPAGTSYKPHDHTFTVTGKTSTS